MNTCDPSSDRSDLLSVRNLLRNTQRWCFASFAHGCEGDLRDELVGELVEGCGELWAACGVGIEVFGWVPGVHVLTERGVDGDGSEEWKTEFLRHLLRAAFAEDVVFFAVVTDEVGHVLDDPEAFDAERFEHVGSADRIVLRDFLRGAHNDRAGELDALGKGQWDIACSWGEVDDEVVEFAPLRAFDELVERSVRHWSAPNEWFFWINELAHCDGLDAVDEKGLECGFDDGLVHRVESEHGGE